MFCGLKSYGKGAGQIKKKGPPNKEAICSSATNPKKKKQKEKEKSILSHLHGLDILPSQCAYTVHLSSHQRPSWLALAKDSVNMLKIWAPREKKQAAENKMLTLL